MVEFDVGRRHDFETLVAGSKYIITTSITEGFGFSFLEPWTSGKLLWGRKLPDICHDFEKNGIRLHHLYSKLRVPIAWVDEKSLFDRWHDCVCENSALYGYQIPKAEIEERFNDLTRDQSIDFGLLNEQFQKQVISEVLAHRAAKETLISLNPFLAEPGRIENKHALIEHNREAVSRNYGKSRYRKRLLDIYTTVLQTRVHHRIDKKRLLISFFNLNNFSLLKWCNHVA